MLILCFLLICLDDCFPWCGSMGCFIWWWELTCLCAGRIICPSSWCYCNSQAAKSFKQFIQIIWFPFWITSVTQRVDNKHVYDPLSCNKNRPSQVFLLSSVRIIISYKNHALHIEIHSLFATSLASVTYL